MSARVLRLRVPGLLGPFAAADLPGELGRYPALEQWLARGVEGHGVVVDPSPPLDALGALAWIADGGDASDGCWSRAQLVSLCPDGAGVRLLNAALAPSELTQLRADLATLLTAHGVELHGAAERRWYLRSERPPPPRPAPDTRMGHFISDSVPRRPEALAWAALFNELEMALHQHPINRCREQAGRLPVNALWVWGGGRSPRPPGDFPWRTLYSDDPAWRGWAQLAGAEARELGAAPLLDASGDNTLVAVDWAQTALAAADPLGWIEAVDRIERGLAGPALAALGRVGASARRWDAIELHGTLQRPPRVLTRTLRARPWRRRAPLSRFLTVAGRGDG